MSFSEITRNTRLKQDKAHTRTLHIVELRTGSRLVKKIGIFTIKTVVISQRTSYSFEELHLNTLMKCP